MSLETNYTVEDTKSDFERFKEGGLDWNQIRGFNDEHKWWIIRNKPKSSFLCHNELVTDEMLKECILLGYCDFVRFSITGTYYTFDNKGCHGSSNFLTTKVFTVYLDKNTIYSVVNSERKEIEAVFHDGKRCTSLKSKQLSDQQATHSAKTFLS